MPSVATANAVRTLPYRRMRLHAGCALVVCPEMHAAAASLSLAQVTESEPRPPHKLRPPLVLSQRMAAREGVGSTTGPGRPGIRIREGFTCEGTFHSEKSALPLWQPEWRSGLPLTLAAARRSPAGA